MPDGNAKDPFSLLQETLGKVGQQVHDIVQPSTEQLVQNLVDEYARNLAAQAGIQANPDFAAYSPDQDALGNQTLSFTEDGLKLQGLRTRQQAIEDQLTGLGYDVKGKSIEDLANSISPNIAAQIAQQERDRLSREKIAEEDRKVAREQLAQQDQQNARQNVIDMLEKEIERGNLQVSEAVNRTNAAISSADIQSQLLQNLGPYSVDPGSDYVPYFGPNDPLAQIAASLGSPIGGIPLGGTMNVNPGALTSGITEAANTGIGNALGSPLDAAAKALAGLGVQTGGGSKIQMPGMPATAAAQAAGRL